MMSATTFAPRLLATYKAEFESKPLRAVYVRCCLVKHCKASRMLICNSVPIEL